MTERRKAAPTHADRINIEGASGGARIIHLVTPRQYAPTPTIRIRPCTSYNQDLVQKVTQSPPSSTSLWYYCSTTSFVAGIVARSFLPLWFGRRLCVMCPPASPLPRARRHTSIRTALSRHGNPICICVLHSTMLGRMHFLSVITRICHIAQLVAFPTHLPAIVCCGREEFMIGILYGWVGT